MSWQVVTNFNKKAYYVSPTLKLVLLLYMHAGSVKPSC